MRKPEYIESALVSINGVDETGKTTAIDLVLRDNPSKITMVPKITRFDPRWGQPSPHEGLIGQGDWNFRIDNVQEFMDVTFHSIAKLISYVNQLSGPKIFMQDRGLMTIMSSYSACLRLKTGMSSADASGYIAAYGQKHNLNFTLPREDVSVLLRATDDLDKSVDFTIDRMRARDPSIEESFIKVYRKYQRLFNEELDVYYKAGRFTHTISCTDPIPSVQNKVWQAILSNVRGCK